MIERDYSGSEEPRLSAKEISIGLACMLREIAVGFWRYIPHVFETREGYLGKQESKVQKTIAFYEQ